MMKGANIIPLFIIVPLAGAFLISIIARKSKKLPDFLGNLATFILLGLSVLSWIAPHLFFSGRRRARHLRRGEPDGAEEFGELRATLDALPLGKRLGKWGGILIVLHLLAHEVPMAAFGVALVAHSCHEHTEVEEGH